MGRTVMIVDDDIDDIDIFIDAVRRVDSSLCCVSAQNGIDAINLLNHGEVHPDFIFVDLNMPKLNGKQFIASLKQSHAFDDSRIIVYSTSKNERDEAEVLRLGADEFITKPISLDTLCADIARIISDEHPVP
jgi:CheY-like chemotaxis protein